MKRIVGTVLLIGSTVALIFFAYHGTLFIWFIGLIGLASIGVLLIRSSAKQFIATTKTQKNQEREKLKASGEKIKVEYDSCEFKESSYTNEVVDERAFRGPGVVNLDMGNVINEEFVGQCLLIYHYSNGGNTEDFKQAFPCDAESLKFYVLNNSVTLYVDRFDRSRYFFDLKAD